MENNQPVTIGVLQGVLQEELQKQGKEFKKEIKAQGRKFVSQMKIIDENIQSRIELLAENILDVREKIAVLTEMVEKNTEDIEIIKLNVELIRGDLKTKVEKEEFLALEKRVFVLEQKERKRVNC
ncbi:MAG: hypothetical protein V1690_01945 [Candidatus Moraniibacteriota bacterium]